MTSPALASVRQKAATKQRAELNEMRNTLTGLYGQVRVAREGHALNPELSKKRAFNSQREVSRLMQHSVANLPGIHLWLNNIHRRLTEYLTTGSSVRLELALENIDRVIRLVGARIENHQPGKASPALKSARRKVAQKKSEAYREGYAEGMDAFDYAGHVRVNPSWTMQQDWRYAWKEFMAGWEAARKEWSKS